MGQSPFDASCWRIAAAFGRRSSGGQSQKTSFVPPMTSTQVSAGRLPFCASSAGSSTFTRVRMPGSVSPPTPRLCTVQPLFSAHRVVQRFAAGTPEPKTKLSPMA